MVHHELALCGMLPVSFDYLRVYSLALKLQVPPASDVLCYDHPLERIRPVLRFQSGDIQVQLGSDHASAQNLTLKVDYHAEAS